MSKLKTLGNLIKNPRLIYPILGWRGYFHGMPDEVYLKKIFRAKLGYDLNLKNPQTFNEKLQWLKLHDRNPLYTKLVDKCEVKHWVADQIGPEYVLATYAQWDSAEDIDISDLPNRFVLKTNHDSGGVVVCKDKTAFDLDSAKKKLGNHLKQNYFWGGREWPYKDIKPCVFAEEYIEPNSEGDVPDYKLFRFSNGRIITLHMTDRFTSLGLTETFFDEEWRPLSLTEDGYPTKKDAPKPTCFEEMKSLAQKLTSKFPFARVDFYESSEKLFFGEITLYPKSGLEKFDPTEWDTTLGSWIELPFINEESQRLNGGGVALGRQDNDVVDT